MSRIPIHCRGPIDRRTWLTVGGISLGALASGGLPGLSSLLAAEAASRQRASDFSVILFWANGGPSHIDLFDLKPQAPAEYRGPFRPIQHQRPRHGDQRAPAAAGEDGRQVHADPQPAPRARTSTPAARTAF